MLAGTLGDAWSVSVWFFISLCLKYGIYWILGSVDGSEDAVALLSSKLIFTAGDVYGMVSLESRPPSSALQLVISGPNMTSASQLAIESEETDYSSLGPHRDYDYGESKECEL